MPGFTLRCAVGCSAVRRSGGWDLCAPMGDDFALGDTKFVRLTIEKLAISTVGRWSLGRSYRRCAAARGVCRRGLAPT